MNDVPVRQNVIGFLTSNSVFGALFSRFFEALPEATMLSRNLKNVLVVSVGFLFLFMAAGGLQNLQVRMTL